MSDWDEAVTSMADVVARDFRSALAEAADAKDRTYYDADADGVAARAYYGDAGPEQLGELIRTTHRETPRYKPSLKLYPWIDLQPDGKLKSLYTAEIFEPEQLIEADLVVLQERAARMIRLRGLEEGDSAALEAKVEAQLPFNCEHVVPQSWSGSTSRCAATCATCSPASRGATAFAETPRSPTSPTSLPSRPRASRARGASATTAGRATRTGSSGPRKGRGGPAAFYFRLRYPEQISGEEMSDDRWPVLMTGTSRIPSPPGSCTATPPSPSARATGTRSSTTPSGCRRCRWRDRPRDQAPSSTAYDVMVVTWPSTSNS